MNEEKCPTLPKFRVLNFSRQLSWLGSPQYSAKSPPIGHCGGYWSYLQEDIGIQRTMKVENVPSGSQLSCARPTVSSGRASISESLFHIVLHCALVSNNILPQYVPIRGLHTETSACNSSGLPSSALFCALPTHFRDLPCKIYSRCSISSIGAN